MKSIPAVVLALLLLPLYPSPAPLPEPAPPTMAAPLAPTEAPTAFDPVVRAPSSTTDTRLDPRPRWPEGWPSLDLSPAPMGPRAAAEFQTMGVGELDVVLEGTGGDPTGERQVVVEADFAEVGGRRFNFSNLFLIDGVRPNENIRGQAFDLFIEDAIQEVSTAVAGASVRTVGGDDPGEVGNRQTGILSGTVVDTQGKPLPGVIVTVTGIGPPVVQVTGALGEFRFYLLPPGGLRLMAELEGFSTVEYPDLSIETGTNTTLEVTLSPAVEEVITVTSESPLLDERKIQQGTTISQIELDKIPTARDPWEVIKQTPSVISDRDGAHVFVVDGVILSGPEEALRGSPTLYDFDAFEELEAATGGTEASLPSGGLTFNLNPSPRGSNNPRASARYLLSDEQASANWGQIDIDIAEAPDGTSCVDRFAVNDTAGNPLPDAAQLGPGEWVGIVPDSSLRMTLDGLQGDLHPRTWILEFLACDGDEGQRAFAFDFDRWLRSLLTTEAGPADLPEATAETGNAPTGDQVTFRLEDRTAGVGVTLFDRDGPRRLGTTGEGGVTRVPAGEVEDGTALIAYAVACGEDKQLVLVRPEDEEAFLDAYGDCAERRLERFAWYPGDVRVDLLRGLARWIQYPRAPQPADLDPVRSPEALGDPSGPGGSASDIQVAILGTGGSTGPVVEAYLVNHGYEPVRIRAEGLVLEPVTEEDLDPAARTRLQVILDAFSSGKPVSLPQAGTEAREARVVRVLLPAYCLEFAKDVPVEGTLFRIAGREAQQAAARFREVVRVSRRLQDTGALHPDGDPESYFHSTRQWATWADELALDRDGFEEAFVEHARKNFDAAGRPWSAEVEAQVRALVPNRWAGITAVLEEADSSLRERGGADAGEMPAEGDPAEREPARLDPARPAAGLGDGVADPRRSR